MESFAILGTDVELGIAPPVDEVSTIVLCTSPFISTERPVGGVGDCIVDDAVFGRNSEDIPN